MIKQAKAQAKKHKLNIAAYTALIIAGVTGYNSLLLELGELRAEVGFNALTIESEMNRANKYESKYEECVNGD